MDLLQTMNKQIETRSEGKTNVILGVASLLGGVERVRERRSGERPQGCAVATAAITDCW
jgi:hypothetical protein